MKNKRKQAVALTYEQDRHDAPYVSAKGAGELAEKILELAKEHDIPVQKDASLVSVLSQLDVNESIPPDLYTAVAEVFAFIYRLDRHRSNK
ncbi:MAG TPA: EscU/YscU/HrcU family type III secretion system export apparatus switch protein [Bacillales bacterium]|jgi:flagellar biosynthesis protein|nr:EscU/YscU/HrcU family type III secretion system export apparatus switch protein [Bacillales bacterium]